MSGFGLNSSSLAEAGSTPVVKVDAVAKPPAATLPAMFLPSAAIASRRLLPVRADVGHAYMTSDIKRGRASIAGWVEGGTGAEGDVSGGVRVCVVWYGVREGEGQANEERESNRNRKVGIIPNRTERANAKNERAAKVITTLLILHS